MKKSPIVCTLWPHSFFSSLSLSFTIYLTHMYLATNKTSNNKIWTLSTTDLLGNLGDKVVNGGSILSSDQTFILDNIAFIWLLVL